MSIFTSDKLAAYLRERGANVLTETRGKVFAIYGDKKITAGFDPQTGRFQLGYSLVGVTLTAKHKELKSLVEALELPALEKAA